LEKLEYGMQKTDSNCLEFNDLIWIDIVLHLCLMGNQL